VRFRVEWRDHSLRSRRCSNISSLELGDLVATPFGDGERRLGDHLLANHVVHKKARTPLVKSQAIPVEM